MDIREIQPQDNLQVAKVIKEVMTAYDCVGEGYSITDPELDDMFTAYHHERAIFFVVAEGDKIYGCGGIGPLAGAEPTICELKKMYFYPELRGRGFGRQLMERCLSEARSMGYTKCYLETVERMAKANILYKKFGFQKLCAQEGATGHGGCDVYYSKDLVS